MSEIICPKYTIEDFKTPGGKLRTQSLFWEYRSPEVPPFFTIKKEDHIVDGIRYRSLRQLYLSYDHIPGFEYEFANEVLGGWDHWLSIQKNKLFTKLIEGWRYEKELQIQAQALKALYHTALTEGSKGTQAAKWLVDKGWKGVKRGRPSKEDVERERKIQAALADEVTEDIERLGLHVINGTKQ